MTTVKKFPISSDIDAWSYSFKVAGVDLKKWLGSTGIGLMDVWVSDKTGTRHAGPYNASATSGARSPALTAIYLAGLARPYVSVAIERTSGYALCSSTLTIK